MLPIDKIKELVVRLVKDDQFRQEIESQSTVCARTKFLEESGYEFVKSELEAATIEILELAERGLFPELTEGELNAVMGGSFRRKPKHNYVVNSLPSNPSTPPTSPVPQPQQYPPYFNSWWGIHNGHNPQYSPDKMAHGAYGVSVPPRDWSSHDNWGAFGVSNPR
jgi:hypothetical protein